MIVTAAIMLKDGRVLIAKRKEGKWEFPGGKVEKGESAEECVKRELKEEMGIEVKKIKFFVKARDEENGIELRVFLVKFEGNLMAKEHEEIKWVGMREIFNYDFMNADRKVIKELKKRWDEVKTW